MTNTAQNFEEKLITGLLNSVTLTSYGVQKTAAYSPGDVIDGAGVLVCEITNREQRYPGGTVWFLSVSLLGMTYASVDPDRAVIRQIFDDTLKSVQGWTAATLTETVGLKIDGILPVTTAAIRGSEDSFTFSVDFQLAMSDVTF